MIELDYELVLKNPHLWDNKTLDWAREKELKENERLAALQYCADLYGFSLVRKARS